MKQKWENPIAPLPSILWDKPNLHFYPMTILLEAIGVIGNKINKKIEYPLSYLTI